MSFSFTNPDVDPLSLSERVRKLESRLGPGGSGGGSFVGSIPDFDQYPDNAIKVTNEGMILKLSIDDIGRSFSCPYYPGVELKTCIFVPYQYGMLSSPYFIFARIRFKNNVNDFKAQSQSFSAQIPFDVSDYKDHLIADPMVQSLFYVGFNGGGVKWFY